MCVHGRTKCQHYRVKWRKSQEQRHHIWYVMYIVMLYCMSMVCCLQTQISLEKKELNVLRTFGKSKLEKVCVCTSVQVSVLCSNNIFKAVTISYDLTSKLLLWVHTLLPVTQLHYNVLEYVVVITICTVSVAGVHCSSIILCECSQHLYELIY